MAPFFTPEVIFIMCNTNYTTPAYPAYTEQTAVEAAKEDVRFSLQGLVDAHIEEAKDALDCEDFNAAEEAIAEARYIASQRDDY